MIRLASETKLILPWAHQGFIIDGAQLDTCAWRLWPSLSCTTGILLFWFHISYSSFPGGPGSKESACSVEDQDLIPGFGRSTPIFLPDNSMDSTAHRVTKLEMTVQQHFLSLFPLRKHLFGVLKQILSGSSSYVRTKPRCLSEVISLEPVLSTKTEEP